MAAIQWLPYVLGLMSDKVRDMVIKAVTFQKQGFNVQVRCIHFTILSSCTYWSAGVDLKHRIDQRRRFIVSQENQKWLTTSHYSLLHFLQLQSTLKAPTSPNIVKWILWALWSSLDVTGGSLAQALLWAPCADQPENKSNGSFNISMGTRTWISVWSIFGHKGNRRSLLGFLEHKHSEMICEKSWLEVPCFYFLFTKSRLTPYCRHFPRRPD